MTRSVTFPVIMGFAFVAFSGCLTPGEGSEPPYLVLGDPERSGLDDWPGAFDSSTDTYDFDGDGDKEIVAHSTDKKVYVFDSRSGRALAVLTSRYPPSWYIDQVSNGVKVGVLKPGEPPSIVTANHAGYLTAWQYDPDGSSKKRFAFTKSWEVRPTKCERNPSMDATAQLVDLTGDGKLEVLVQAEEVGLYAYTAAGDLLWAQCWGGGNSSPVAADLDGDGKMEAIFASDAGMISVLRGVEGSALWTFDATDPDYHVKPGSVSIDPAVAELDGTPPMEVLFTARHAPEDDPERFDEFNMAIFAVRQKAGAYEGELVWKQQPEWANPLSYTPLLVEDVDKDGSMDVFGMDWNTIGHRPGAWERLGPGHAFRLDAEGEVVWMREVDAWWSNKAIALADLNADGSRELVVNGPRGENDGFQGLDPDSGRAKTFHETPGWKVSGGAVFDELYGDGGQQLFYRVMPDTAEDDDKGPGAILVHTL